MKKIFGEYGRVIVIVVATICIIAMISVMMSAGGIRAAFGNIAGQLSGKTATLIDTSVEINVGSGGAGGSGESGGNNAVEDNLPSDTDTMIYRLNSLDDAIDYVDFTITADNRTKIGYTDETTDLVIPVAFKDTDGEWYKIVTIEGGAFCMCENLNSVVIPDSVSSVGAAFAYCFNLTSVKLSNSMTSINGGLFMYTGLSSISIPDGVQSIGGAAFEGCMSLESIIIPNSVTYIDGCAFQKDSNTEDGFNVSITFKGTIEEWNAITLDEDWAYLSGITEIVCSDGMIRREFA